VRWHSVSGPCWGVRIWQTVGIVRPVIHNTHPIRVSRGKSITSGCLPRELLSEVLEHIPLPVVLHSSSDQLFLNAEARALWRATDADSWNLPVIVDGEVQSVLTLPPAFANGAGSTVLRQVREPGGQQCEAHILRSTHAAGLSAWDVVVLRPLEQGPSAGELLTDKVTRLKAIVHEFRNTLTAAREALALVREGAVGELNAEQRRFLDSALDDIEGLGRAMVDLTSLWVTQAGILRMMPRTVDIGRVVEQTTVGARSIAEKHGVSLRVEVADPPPILTGDHELLVQALRNVLTNALRHTSAGGEIRVRAFSVDARRNGAPTAGRDSHAAPPGDSGADGVVMIEVHDSGGGIEPGDQERIFRAFERGNSDGSGQGSAGSGGMGLGLTIARDIASRHGGTLHLHSTPGRGSCFVFRFPQSETCARSWMVRTTQQAIEDVRPLGVPLASILMRFESGNGGLEERVHPDLLSALQQVAIRNLRPTDTVLAIEGQLLLLIRGSTRSAAYTMIERILHSLVDMFRAGRAAFGEYRMIVGVAAYPEDGSGPDTILSRAEADLSAFPIGTGRSTEDRHE
jgi:signal transduction histidine kinase